MVLPMGVQSDSSFTQEACQQIVTVTGFRSEADILSPSSSAFRDGHHPICETSSSNCSLSENDEHKDNFRTSNSSRDLGMLVKVETLKSIEENQSVLPEKRSRDNRMVSNQQWKERELECLSDNVSCVSGSGYTEKIADRHRGDTERQHVIYSPASVDSFTATEKDAKDQPALCSLAEKHVDHPDPIKLTIESSKGADVLSNKSDLSELSSLRNSHIVVASSKGEPSECSEEQVESSLARAASFKSNGCSQNYDESVNEMNDRKIAAEAEKGADQGEYDEKLVSRSDTFVGDKSGPGNMEEEVNICDICGDVGREDLLATCSKCNDGAEHTYCMRVKLDKVPEGNWTCEGCLLENEKQKKKQNNTETEADKAMGSSLDERREVGLSQGSSDIKIKSESIGRGLGVDYGRKSRISTLQLSTKRPADTLDTISGAKRRAVAVSENSSKLPKPHCKAVILQESSFINLNTGKINFKDSLSKSKSFDSVDLKANFQRSQAGARETTSDNTKEGTKILTKSASFNAGAERVNATYSDVKKCSSDFSHVEDMKKLRCEKEENVTQGKSTRKLQKHLMRSLVAKNYPSSSGKNIPPQGHGFPAKNCHDGRVVQEGRLSNSFKSTTNDTHKSYQKEEQYTDVKEARLNIEVLTKASFDTKANNLVSGLPAKGPSCLKDSLSFASAVDLPPWVSIIPQPDYIWRGGFEIRRSGRPLISCSGIQAHLSTHASPKVLEVVHKLPQKLPMEQVRRLDMWPTQFLQSHIKEENIALYFFAKDLESYEKNYKRLLDCLVKSDCGLKGNLDGVELLIFSSNLLPEKSQSWNKLLFLWGVFRGRRRSCSQPGSQQTIGISQNLCSSVKSSGSIAASGMPSNTQVTLNSVLLEGPTLALDGTVKTCENVASSHVQKLSSLESSNGEPSVVDAPTRNEPCCKEELHGENFQGEESDSKRKQDMNLNVERATDSAMVREERECKRMKSSDVVFERNNSVISKYLDDRFCLNSNLLGTSSGEEQQFDKVCSDSILPAASVSADSSSKLKNPPEFQAVSANSTDHGTLNLDLSLGIGERSSTRTIEAKHPTRETSNEDYGCSTSLSLSLGLSSLAGGEQTSKLVSATKQLLLHGGQGV